MYGIPNMKLDKSVIQRRIEKMTAEGVTFCCGRQLGEDLTQEELKKEFDAVVLCCGARKPRELGVDTDGVQGVLPALEYLTASTKAVLAGEQSLRSAKGRQVIVVGNGDTATDCVGTALRQGCASVTQGVAVPGHRGKGGLRSGGIPGPAGKRSETVRHHRSVPEYR